MNIEEGDPAAAIERCGARLGYFHVNESHRGYLGTGTIDFGAQFAALARIGYRGGITFEAFSAGIGDPKLNADLAVWRQIWTDSDDLARHARRFMAAEWEAAEHRITASP
jgi:D-psicose/D-tagatose/L-ribulose 3-epimerase